MQGTSLWDFSEHNPGHHIRQDEFGTGNHFGYDSLGAPLKFAMSTTAIPREVRDKARLGTPGAQRRVLDDYNEVRLQKDADDVSKISLRGYYKSRRLNDKSGWPRMQPNVLPAGVTSKRLGNIPNNDGGYPRDCGQAGDDLDSSIRELTMSMAEASRTMSGGSQSMPELLDACIEGDAVPEPLLRGLPRRVGLPTPDLLLPLVYKSLREAVLRKEAPLNRMDDALHLANSVVASCAADADHLAAHLRSLYHTPLPLPR